MTKRYGNEINQGISKKQRLEENLDDLWGDDLDEDAINDCINLATQVVEEDKVNCTNQNVTLLPTYNAFKEPKSIFSSTQFELSICRPSTSKNEVSKDYVNDLCAKVKKLEQQCEEKEGEVLILRNQLKDSKLNVQIEHQKKQSEWKEKLNQTLKEVKSAKTELELKNLEIANLKQKILNITKYNHLDSTLNQSQQFSSRFHPVKCGKAASASDSNQEKKTLKNVQYRIQSIAEPVHPLNHNTSYFLLPQERYIVEQKFKSICRNSIPYLKNQASLEDISGLINSKPPIFCINKKELNLDYIYPEVSYFLKCDVHELENEENVFRINKIICVSLQFLNDLLQHLENVESNCRTQDLQQTDACYLDDASDVNEDFLCDSLGANEIGFKAGLCVNILGELLPFSGYLQNYMFCNNYLRFRKRDELKTYFESVLQKTASTSFAYLNLILKIVTVIGRIRKSSITSNFLCNIVNFLISICLVNKFDSVCDVFCQITKEILYSRPPIRVIHKIITLLKHASHFPSFMQFLCRKPGRSTIKSDIKKGITYFKKDSCCLYVFTLLFYNTVFKLKHKNFPVDVCLNVSSFVCNIFQCAEWMHHQDGQQCECLGQLYKLVVEIIYKTLQKYQEETRNCKNISGDWLEFFHNKTILRVLNLISFNSFELLERYVSVYAQYKEILTCFQLEVCDDDRDIVKEIESLNIVEDIPDIEVGNFQHVMF